MEEEFLTKLGKKHPQALIAGGASYLGTALSKALLDRGFKVLVLDDFSSGKSKEFEKLCSHPRFKFCIVDVAKGLPKDLGPIDFIFHLARLEAHAREEKDTNLSTLLTNAWGTKNLLELARKTKARFLLASTIDVYQNAWPFLSRISYGEVTSEEEKIYSLSEAKRFAEAFVWEYAKQFRLNARIVRLADVYGPEVDFKSCGTLGMFLEQVLSGEDLLVYGEGLGKEYYLYIEDAVSGILEAMFSPETSGGIFPLCPKKPISVLELAYLVKNFAPPHTKIVFHPGLESLEVPEFKIIEEGTFEGFSWKPETNLAEGIGKTLKKLREDRALKRLEAPISGKEKRREKRRRRFLALLEGISLKSLGPRKLGFAVSLVAIALILFYPFFYSLALEFSGEGKFEKAQSHFSSFNLSEAEKEAKGASVSFEKAERGFARTFWFFNLVRLRDWSRERARSLRVRRYFSKSLAQTVEAISIVGGEALSKEIVSVARGKVSQAQNMLFMAQAEMGDLDDPWASFLAQNKEDLSFLSSLLNSPEKTESPESLREEIRKHGWYLK